MDQSLSSSYQLQSLQPKRILIAEDDRNLSWMLRENIESVGYVVELVSNGEEVVERISQSVFDLYLLDIMMPKMDGIKLSRWIRKMDKRTPILFLTARSMEADVIEGFEAGGDDYVTKPFNVDELLWRMKSLLRRTEQEYPEPVSDVPIALTADCNYLRNQRLLKSDNDEVRLSKREAEIFECILSAKGKVVSRDNILFRVWKANDVYKSKALDVHLTHIRKVLKAFPGVEITNVHGLGYTIKLEGGNASSPS